MARLSDLLGITQEGKLDELLGITNPLKDLIEPNNPIDPRIFDKPEVKKPSVMDKIRGLSKRLKK